ncbi:dnajc21 [Symbiodinium natans]|uniref:Dnajc21 protein n=1 Tax=Symbiodinium natans TaxID=878477 RepID=A0A812UGD4_9DINO|nr:dnajc21 [Symbiodinium natans]
MELAPLAPLLVDNLESQGGDREDREGPGRPSVLAEAIITATSMPERLAAVHQLLEGLLHQPQPHEPRLCKDLCLAKLVTPLLDLTVETERLPHLPVKLLWCLAAREDSPGALDDAIPTILGILRGTEDTLLAGSSLQLLAELAHLKSKALSSQLCNPKTGVAQLLLRSLWRWGLQAPHLEITISLLNLLEFAVHVPCHRNMLRAEVALAADYSLTLSEALSQVALGAETRQAQSTDERFGWTWVHAQSRQLAREWTGILQVAELSRPGEEKTRA